MNKTLVAAAFVLSSVSQGLAQQSTAMEIARAQEACGEDLNDTIISARFLEDGRVGVRCARPAGVIGAGGGAVAAGTGAAVAAAAVSPGVVAGLFTLVLGAAAVGGSSSTSDTR